MRYTFKRFIAVAVLSQVAFAPTLLRADDDTQGGLRLDYWGFTTSGNATLRGSSTDINNKDKSFDRENFGIILGGERRFDSWGINLDLLMAKQSDSKQVSSAESLDWDAEFAVLTGGAFLSFLEKEFGSDGVLHLDGLAGIRGYMNSLTIKHEPFDPNTDENQTVYSNWVDPYVGLRINTKLNESWAIGLYGDMGGFGIGNASDLSALVRGEIIWSVTPGLNLIGGYRMFNLKSAREHGDNHTEFDLHMGGPTIGIEGRF